VGNESRGIGLIQVVWILAGLLVAVAAGFHIFHSVRGSSIRFNTPYQAVLLTNGSVYFGHLQDYGSSHPVLTDVFYVVSQTDPDTKQVKSSLIKRGKEMHEPDRMYINPNQIVFVETVGTNSAVAQHIAKGPPTEVPHR
jgi:small nuclear ribonucleoprotein (snRNP)-like protein